MNKKITPKDSIIYINSQINTESIYTKNKYLEETSSENHEFGYKDLTPSKSNSSC